MALNPSYELRFHHSHLGILDRPPEPVIGRPFGRPVGGRSRPGSHDHVIASEAKQSIWPRKERMDCFRGACHRARIRATRWLAMTSKHTFATSRRDASESVGWVEPSAKPIIYANCDDGYRWRSTHPTSSDVSQSGVSRQSWSANGAPYGVPMAQWHQDEFGALRSRIAEIAR